MAPGKNNYPIADGKGFGPKIEAAISLWNARRVQAGRSSIEIGGSADFGTVVLGDIGTRESITFTAIGNTVTECRDSAEP